MLITPLIKISSKVNDLILDPYMGTWTTGVVAKYLHRNFIGAEINEEYNKIGEQRLAQQVLF